jgi:hypothetical protein
VTGLRDEIANERPKRRKNRIEQIAARLNDDDRVAFIDALNDPSITAVAIIRVLARRGIKLSESSVSTYRSGLHVDP